MNRVEHIAGQTFHGRRGAVANAFRYGVDYVLLDPEAPVRAPALFSRNRANVMSLWDSDHGGPARQGRGAPWLREVLAREGVDTVANGQILLLAQPRVLGYVFNPASFWLVHDRQGGLRVVVAEVTNTFGDRHAYLCHHDDLRPIGPRDRLGARKAMHVSPFQPVSGGYTFRFDIRADRIGIWIDFDGGDPDAALYATLTGRRRPLTVASAVGAGLRRPLGARRVMTLIHWQALKLWWRGARYRDRPEAPPIDTSGPESPGHGAGGR